MPEASHFPINRAVEGSSGGCLILPAASATAYSSATPDGQGLAQPACQEHGGTVTIQESTLKTAIFTSTPCRPRPGPMPPCCHPADGAGGASHPPLQGVRGPGVARQCGMAGVGGKWWQVLTRTPSGLAVGAVVSGPVENLLWLENLDS
ncbi:hypothetical protein E2C01_081029 [Portunus trituberculatus]|uniref:Uncharacterized protein n=1 Tax=Portunus trituberculatus TaxID=210409 RepID=A0A5B7IL61_PORTR|nr:hypothetical protein [Portunus trituberculatus]